MESHERRSRQSNVPGFGGQAQQHHQHTSHAHSTSSSNQADHRYRQHAHHQSQPTVPSGTGRGAAAAAAAAYPAQYSYQVPDLQTGSGSLQYQAEQHQAQQPAQSQQQQPHSHQTANNQASQQPGQVQAAYHHNMYYPQPIAAQQAGTPPSPYDSYAAAGRQSTGMDVLTNQMVSPNYYVGPQGDAPTSAPNAASMAAQGVNVQQYTNPAMTYATAAAQQSPSGGRGTGDSLAGYGAASGMTDPSATVSAAQATYGQQGYNPAATVVQNTTNLDSAYETYLDELRHIFVNVQNGDLREAGKSLLRISDWLLGNAESLGLVRDDESMHGERLKLWTDFNHCWLVVLQRQREMTVDWQTGQRPANSTSLLEHDQMEAMGKELVRLCDVMEKHGLVDYQMGVWEEEIVNLLIQCLELWESGMAPPNATIPANTSSSNGRRR